MKLFILNKLEEIFFLFDDWFMDLACKCNNIARHFQDMISREHYLKAVEDQKEFGSKTK